MHGTMRRALTWTPRIVVVAFAALLAVFALDAFQRPIDPGRTARELLVHLIPSAVVILALALAWRRAWPGAILFPLLAVVHLVSSRGRLDGAAYAVIDGPLLLAGMLFLIDWRARASQPR